MERINDIFVRLTEDEANALEKIARKTKMDCWFYLTSFIHDVYEVVDLESSDPRYCHATMNFTDAIEQLVDGIVDPIEDEFYGLTQAEIDAFYNLLVQIRSEPEPEEVIVQAADSSEYRVKDIKKAKDVLLNYYSNITTVSNAKVEILENPKTGEMSFGWYIHDQEALEKQARHIMKSYNAWVDEHRLASKKKREEQIIRLIVDAFSSKVNIRKGEKK